MKKIILTVSALSLLSCAAWAGPGHDHGSPGDSAGRPLSEIVLTDVMISNLGIQTVPVVSQNVSKTIDLIASVDYLPENQAIISARADGAVSQILVKTGQSVKKGEAVIVFQPRLVGNPPVTLVAPIDGYVTEQNVVIGQSVTPDQALLRIADISEVLVRGQAYEDVPQSALSVGRPVMVTASGLSGEVFEGTVQRADASFRAGTRVREIWAVVENPDGKLLGNMQAHLSVATGDALPALVVPQRAVLGDTGNYFLYVREDDHFYRRDVTLGQKFGPLREIVSGLSDGEDVVTLGNYQLQFVTSSAEHEHGEEPAAEKADDHDHGSANDDHDHDHDEPAKKDDHGHAH